jgi:hypothetical protein
MSSNFHDLWVGADPGREGEGGEELCVGDCYKEDNDNGQLVEQRDGGTYLRNYLSRDGRVCVSCKDHSGDAEACVELLQSFRARVKEWDQGHEQRCHVQVELICDLGGYTLIFRHHARLVDMDEGNYEETCMFFQIDTQAMRIDGRFAEEIEGVVADRHGSDIDIGFDCHPYMSYCEENGVDRTGYRTTGGSVLPASLMEFLRQQRSRTLVNDGLNNMTINASNLTDVDVSRLMECVLKINAKKPYSTTQYTFILQAVDREQWELFKFNCSKYKVYLALCNGDIMQTSKYPVASYDGAPTGDYAAEWGLDEEQRSESFDRLDDFFGLVERLQCSKFIGNMFRRVCRATRYLGVLPEDVPTKPAVDLQDPNDDLQPKTPMSIAMQIPLEMWEIVMELELKRCKSIVRDQWRATINQ